MKPHLQVAPETTEGRLARLRREWAEIEQQYAQRDATRDRSRAQLLTQAVQEGLTQEVIRPIVKLSQAQISRLLLYARFDIPAGISMTITEFRFRQYWVQIGQPHYPRLGRLARDPLKAAAQRETFLTKRDAHEQKAFVIIADCIARGEAPYQRPTKQRSAGGSSQTGSPSRRPRPSRVRKEVTTIYQQELAQPMTDLERLMTYSGTVKFTPSFIAENGRKLKRGMRHLLEALKQYDAIESDSILDDETEIN
jgi:hypothetical protein